MAQLLYMEITNLFWLIPLDLIQRRRRNQTALLSILTKKGQQEISWELLIFSPMKIHLIYWLDIFLQATKDKSLVKDYYIICVLRLCASLATKLDIGEWNDPIWTNYFIFIYIWTMPHIVWSVSICVERK